MKNVVITGANRGIGFSLCEQFSSQGFAVFALCRASSQELDLLAVTHASLTIIENVDVTTQQGLQLMSRSLQNTPIDILINNAGLLRSDNLENIEDANILEQFNINALAPLNVCKHLLKQLTAGSKIAFISSRMGSISDNSSGGQYGYRMSKSALNAAGMSLSQDLKDDQISVAIYHPGWVQTRMVNYSGDISATESATKLCQLIIQQDMSKSGTFTHSNGQALGW
jgi:NAD(P)-dependent dehydrogenase (short-subunit alcohol dehydrogenase family)